jgi:hypothetical protein
MRIWVVAFVSCSTEAAVSIERVPTKLATLRVGTVGTLGDGIDLTTDEQFAFGIGDLRLRRSNDLLTGTIGGEEAGVILRDVGTVESLEEVSLDPLSGTGDGSIPAEVTGHGWAVATHRGCPAAVRVMGTERGPAMSGSGTQVPDAFTGAAIEYTRADCRPLAITLSITVEPGTCPPAQFKVMSSAVDVVIDGGFPKLLVSGGDATTKEVYVPKGFGVTLTARNTVTWSGGCSGNGTCSLTVSSAKSVNAKIDVPHQCIPGP